MGRIRNLIETSTTGIDGSGKTTACLKASEKLAKDGYLVMDLSRPLIEYRGDAQVEHFGRLVSVINAMRVFADASNSRKIAFTANLAVVLLQTRLIEVIALQRVRPEITMTSRDYIIDPVVYATYYSKKLMADHKERRMKQTQLLTGSRHKDIIFWLTLDPEVAIQRIGNRSADSGAAVSSRHRYMHENVDSLRGLQEEYRSAFLVVQRVSPNTEIYELRSDRLDPDDIADNMTRHINSRLTTRVFPR